MAIKSEAAIYKIVEQYIRGSKEPLTCVMLWEHDDVKRHARSPEKVSDFLGHMWRRGLLQRWAVPKNSTDRSRYAYSWIDEPGADEPRKVEKLTLLNNGHKKSNVTITEDEDRVILDFDKFTITMHAKG